MDFETLWQTHERKVANKMTMKKHIRLGAVIVAISLVTLSLGGFAAQKYWIKDNINYTFEADQRLIGEWQSVDFVSAPEDFNGMVGQGTEQYTQQQLAFLSDGRVLRGTTGNSANPFVYSAFTYTKDHILNKNASTDSLYEIRTIDNTPYLFMQWKAGDYTSGTKTEPSYYVFKQVSTKDLIDFKPQSVRQDDTQLPFVNDPDLIGQWQTVDFVAGPDDFSPYDQYFVGDMYLRTLHISEDGRITGNFNEGIQDFMPLGSWTKGSIIDSENNVVEAYEIRQIEGKTYLFYPWISGDVVFGGHKAQYYVLEKK